MERTLTSQQSTNLWKLPACGLLCSLPVMPRYEDMPRSGLPSLTKIANIDLHDV